MSRPLRIELPDAVYHVTSRGNAREPIFLDSTDRLALLNVLGLALERFDAAMLAYCLMGNHHHFVLHTRQANLSRLMRHVNGVFTQRFNRRHGRVGHLFQGRFKAILVDRDRYLLELCRYVELNPVRAGLVAAPGDWEWSSYRAHCGLALSPAWLDTPAVHTLMLGQPPGTAAQVRRATQRYASLVAQGMGRSLWPDGLRQQIYLGDDAFVQRTQAMLPEAQLQQARRAKAIPRAQRSAPMTLGQWLATGQTREQALCSAHRHSGISMSELARELGLSVSRVSRLIARWEAPEIPPGEAKGKT